MSNKTKPSKHPEALLDPRSEEFKDLCRLASEIQQLKPWQFMEEMDVFGVQDPETGELGL